MPEWKPCHLKLKIYTDEKMGVLGIALGTVQNQDVKIFFFKIAMVVVKGAGLKLLGCGWLKELAFVPQLVNQVNVVPASSKKSWGSLRTLQLKFMLIPATIL